MDIEKVQRLINETEYWDAPVLDLYISYFGDEVSMYLYCDEDYCWLVKFARCCHVEYETDVNRRRIAYVKDMKERQLGYYGQKIKIVQGENADEYKVTMDISIMDIYLSCKEITVEKQKLKDKSFFWQK